ncbi:hypothetical protein ACS0TY_035046 [Phlomoides rotata]
MRRAASQPLLRDFHEGDEDEEEEHNFRIKGNKAFRDIDSISKQITCITLHKRPPRRSYEDFSSPENYGSWRQEQRSGAARLKKQLKATWAIQKLIDKQLSRLQTHYNRAMGPTKMSDVAHLLMPKWAQAQELAALFWLGDWRPSTILELLRSLAHNLWDPVGVERALSHLINDIRIEEAVIDEEMTEIQSNCVLHLPFRNDQNAPGIRSEFKKIHRVIVKAQNLRMKALEVAVKQVLSQNDAAEFLVAFVRIQDIIHEVSIKNNTRKSGTYIKEFGV